MLDPGKQTLAVRCLRGSLLAVMRLLWRIEHRGLEHVPREGALLIAANHSTYFDPFWVGVYRLVRYMTWDVFRIPVLGPTLRWFGAFPVSLDNPELGAYKAALGVLARGHVLMIFPEGSRSPDGRLQPFREGMARLALKTGAPIVPVAIHSGGGVWGPRHRLPRLFRKVTVEFLSPIAPPPLGGRSKADLGSETRRLTARVRDAIVVALRDHAQARHRHTTK